MQEKSVILRCLISNKNMILWLRNILGKGFVWNRHMQDLKFIIAKNIQKLRQEKGMTQVELAEKINYSDKTISKWENGDALPDIETLFLIAEFYGLTIDALCSENLQKSIEKDRWKIFLSRSSQNSHVCCVLCA